MPTAEIITIGTEILLGEIVDTNARFIARQLRDAGIDLYRKTTVGDNANRIATAIQQAMESSDIIITTGGLGPTIDDPTREAVALALETETEYRPELWEQIKARFERFGRIPTGNNKRQAYVPIGAIAVENPVGTAPAFISERDMCSIIALPGVPREMEYLLMNTVLPYLKERYSFTGIIKARIIHTAGIGESQIDEMITDLETLHNPTVGLAAHSGQVDVRITVKADTEPEADVLIKEIEIQLRRRLGDWIYGADEETLEKAALQKLRKKGWRLTVVEAGLGGELIRRLASGSEDSAPIFNNIFLGGEVLADAPDSDELMSFVSAYHQTHKAEVCLGVAIQHGREKQNVHMVLITPEGAQKFSRPYGGPPRDTPRWALHHSLDVIRNL